MLSKQDINSKVILVTKNGMGNADPELSQALISKYFQLLIENEYFPGAICFYTEGVKLVVEGSPILPQLNELEQNGVRLIVCSTCLNYFALQDKLKVGILGGMTDIIEAQMLAAQVITI